MGIRALSLLRHLPLVTNVCFAMAVYLLWKPNHFRDYVFYGATHHKMESLSSLEEVSLVDPQADWDLLLDSDYDASHEQSVADEGASRATEEDSEEDELVPRRKPGGYDSRIEQMLYENPEMPILITDAGKSTETGGRYIVYTIRTGVSPCLCPEDAI